MLHKTRDQVKDLLGKTVRPEFLNRVDELIMFRPPHQPVPYPLLPWVLLRRAPLLSRSGRACMSNTSIRFFDDCEVRAVFMDSAWQKAVHALPIMLPVQ